MLSPVFPDRFIQVEQNLIPPIYELLLALRNSGWRFLTTYFPLRERKEPVFQRYEILSFILLSEENAWLTFYVRGTKS